MGPRERYPGSLLFSFRRDPLAFIASLAAYGPVARWRIGPQRFAFLNEPALVRSALVTHHKAFAKGGALVRAKVMMGEGLLTSEGELHQRQRKLIQPAFHRQRIAGFADTMVHYAAAMGDRWVAGQPFDLWREMMHLTLAIVGKTLFSADVEGEAPEIEEAINALLAVFGLVMLPFTPLLLRVPTPRNRRAMQALARLDETIYALVRRRQAEGGEARDLLGMLVAAREDEAGMGDRQLRDEAMTLFLAGHETTAAALTWTWFYLAREPEVEAALHAELAAVLGDRDPTFEDVPRLVLTERILAEAMRLRPPGWAIGRRARQDLDLDGHKIQRNTLVLMSPYVMHRDERFFPEPARFDPARFTPEAKAARPQFAYFPFGGGPRSCVGEPFAWMEGVLVLATLARRWRLRLAPGEAGEPRPMVTLRPRHGLMVTAERR